MATQQWFGYGAPVSITGTEVTLSYDGTFTKNPTWNTIKSWINVNVVTEAPSDSTAYVRKSAAWVRPAHTDITGTLAIASGGTGATTAPTALAALAGAPLASPTFTGTVTMTAATSVLVPTPTTNAQAATKLYVDTNAATRITAVAGALYGWNAAGAVTAKPLNRTVAGTPVTLSADDSGYRILCTSASAVTVTASDFGVGHSCSIQWVGAGQPTIVAGAGVTLVSPNTSPTYTPFARYGSLDLTVVATNTVSVEGNMAVGGGGGPTTYTLWNGLQAPVGTDQDNGSDTAAQAGLTVGLMFQTTVAGNILGVKFWKSTTNTGTHTAQFWDSDGTLLSSGTFTGETASGWQTFMFAAPIAIVPWHVYSISYFGTSGHYPQTLSYFSSVYQAGPIYVSLTGSRFEYATTATRPSQTWLNSNYWVDVIFSSSVALPSSLPTRTTVIGPKKDLIINGVPFLPLVLYHPDDDPTNLALGVNSQTGGFATPVPVISASDIINVNSSAAAGVPQMIELSPYSRPLDFADLSTVSASMKDLPILVQYVIDEPSYSGVNQQDTLTAVNICKNADQNHPTFVIDDRLNVLNWATAADITAIDYYPVRWTGMKYGVEGWDSLSVMLSTIDQVITAACGRPVWLAVQCHYIPSDSYYTDPGRFPTPAEVRMMSYQALQHGINGLMFYDYDSAYGGFLGFKYNPTMVSAFPGITAELKTHMPKYMYGTKVVLNAGNAEIDAVSLTYLGATTTIALNPTARTLAGNILGTAVSMPPMTIRIT